MMNECEKVNKGIYEVHQILSAAHQMVKADMEAKPILNMLFSYEREKSLKLISQYVDKYGPIIDMTYPITGKYVTYQKGFYDDKSDDYIKADLRFTVLIVYLKFAAKYGLNTIAEEAIKKIFGDIKETSNV